MGDILNRVILAITTALHITLLARAICWEAPDWAAQDRVYVASVIRTRSLSRGQSVKEVLFAPGQFSVSHLLDQDPSDIEGCWALAKEAYTWSWEDLPVIADHFWSPAYLDGPPFWALPEYEVETPGSIQRFYWLGGKDGKN